MSTGLAGIEDAWPESQEILQAIRRGVANGFNGEGSGERNPIWSRDVIAAIEDGVKDAVTAALDLPSAEDILDAIRKGTADALRPST